MIASPLALEIFQPLGLNTVGPRPVPALWCGGEKVIRAGPQATGSGLHQGRTVPGPTCPRLRSTVGGRDLGCDHRDPARAQVQPIVQIAWKGIGNWIQGGRAPARGGRHQTLPLPGGTPASRAGGGLVTHVRLRLGNLDARGG